MTNILNLAKFYKESEGGVDASKASVWRLPHFKSKRDTTDLKRANKYLRHMQIRMKGLADNRKWNAVWVYGDILLRRSVAFQIYCFHKTNYGWFWKWPVHYAKAQIKRAQDISRKKMVALKIDRSYILKSDGIRFRPIGAPRPGDKAAMSGIT